MVNKMELTVSSQKNFADWDRLVGVLAQIVDDGELFLAHVASKSQYGIANSAFEAQ